MGGVADIECCWLGCCRVGTTCIVRGLEEEEYVSAALLLSVTRIKKD